MEPDSKIKFQRNNTKRIWVVCSVIAVVIIIGGYIIWRSIPQVKRETTDAQTTQQAADHAKQSAINASTNGNNEAALKNYQKAYDLYKKAGNKDAAESMNDSIKFVKQSIKASQEQTTEAIKNGDQPVKDQQP